MFHSILPGSLRVDAWYTWRCDAKVVSCGEPPLHEVVGGPTRAYTRDSPGDTISGGLDVVGAAVLLRFARRKVCVGAK